MEPTPPPPPPAPLRPQPPADFHLSQDAEHIRLLVVFHYVLAGLTGLMACLPILHFTMGLWMISGNFGGASVPPQDAETMRWFGGLLTAFAGAVILLGWALAVATFLAGRFLSHRRRWMFIVVVAAIQCLSFPFGTALGVFTIIVLLRPTVKALFEDGSAAGTAGHSKT